MDWHVVTHTDPHALDPARWNALLAACPHPTPFLRHEWLAALRDHGCAVPETGWSPIFLAAHPRPQAPPEAVCALYVKTHSYGEYVFDWAWADAYRRAGLAYYPKLLCASPFTPVPGSRLLGTSVEARRALLAAMTQLAERLDCSSAHLLFPAGEDEALAREAGWLMRQGVQFHWSNRHASDPHAAPYADFPDFLSSLTRDKRKKIQQERRRVRDAGIDVQAREGTNITVDDWDFFYDCYRRTYLAHGNPPYLSAGFFREVGRTMAPHWLMFIAQRGTEPVAASLIALDRARGVAYGRYWGARTHVDCLHFELCYYSPLQWCIEQGLRHFEGGAQGEHKMARGLLPVTTWSAHHLRDARFADAVSRYLSQEGAGIEAYVDELNERRPYRDG